MATFVDLVLVTLVSTFCVVLGFSIVGKPLSGYVKQYVNCAILSFLCTFVSNYLMLNHYVIKPIIILMDYCIFIILLKLIFKKKYQRIFLELIIFLIIYSIIELFMAEMFHLIFKFTFDDFNRIEGLTKLSFFEIFLFLAVYRFFPVRDYIERYEDILIKYLLFGLNFFIVFLMSTSFNKGFQSNPNLFYLISLLFFASLLTTFLTIKVFRGPREEIVLQEQFEEFEKALEPVLDELHTIQHNFQHHLETLNELCATVKKESNLGQEVDQHGLESPNPLGGIENFPRLNNKVLKVIIYCKFHEAKAKNIDLRWEIPDEEIEFPLKNYEYTTVIANLLDNACEAVEKNEEVKKDSAAIKGKVILELGRQKRQGYIDVRNTGSIQEETIPNLFKKGYTTKEESLGKKRGLGLYNVKKIVDKYNGNIEVHDWQNQVVFRVSF